MNNQLIMMTTENQFHPNHEYETVTHPHLRIYRVDNIFPPIDNFEIFPTEILWPIFIHLDDIGLLHIASINDRFKAIAQMVFGKRYSDKSFVIEGVNPLPEQYWSFFKVFGDSIKSVQLNEFENIDKNHWIGKMLQKHTKSVAKLCFHDCTFCKSATDILSQHMNITHLTLEQGPFDTSDVLRLPEYQNLKKLELINFRRTSVRLLAKIIRSNPLLESLIIRFCYLFSTIGIIDIVRKHLHHLKEFVLLEYSLEREPLPLSILDDFANSLQDIETLGIAVDTESFDLLRALCSKCKNIKRLELCHVGAFQNIDAQIIQELRLLTKVEYFKLRQYTYNNEIELLVEHFPQLRYIYFDMETPQTYDFILSLLRNNPNLETISAQFLSRDQPLCFMNMHFYDELVKVAGNRHFKIEFEEEGESVLCVTEKELIWRNKIIHWNGYNPIFNHSQITLLDLAKSCDHSETNKKSPFEIILDYLDLNSLFSLSRANRKAKKLVKKYVRQQSLEGKEFTFTDEFQSFHYDGLRAFGPHIICLKAIMLHNNDELHSVIFEYCKHLQILCIN